MDLREWMRWVCTGERRELGWALRALEREPETFSEAVAAGDRWLACALGDVAGVRMAVARDAGWVTGVGGPLGMTPLVAVTHSLLGREERYAAGLVACARVLIAAGADVNGRWVNVDSPGWPLSVLYGAAGRMHCAAMVRVLLEAGARPDDNESLYHSVEGEDAGCTRALLEYGARVTGTNAVARALDFPEVEPLRLLLAHVTDVNETRLLHHAILRGRGMAQIRMLVDAGADVRAVDSAGVSVWRFAQRMGRTDVVELLGAHGMVETLSVEEEFAAACARGDEGVARGLVGRVPGILERLTKAQLRALPEMAAAGGLAGVRTMLVMGWPREVKSGWGATALNWAVYRGDPEMTELLLREGADWRTVHGFKDNVVGTLAWASQAREDRAGPGDYVGCARVLRGFGVPVPGVAYEFSAEVWEYLRPGV